LAIFIDYSTTPNRIVIPQADLTNISGTLYELDTESLRQALKDLEANQDGIVFQDTHRRNAPYTVAGVTYAQSIEIINTTVIAGWIDSHEIFFSPDTTYSVRLTGSNNNLFDLQNAILANTVTQVIPQNSAGLIVAGSGVTAGDITNIASATKDAVWDEPTSGHTTNGTFGIFIQKLLTVAKFLGLK
jgi:hypothetical protein